MSCCLIFVTTLLSWKEPINLFIWIKNFTGLATLSSSMCTSIKWINNSVKLHQKKLTPLSKTMRGKTFVQSKHCPFDEYVEIPEKNPITITQWYQRLKREPQYCPRKQFREDIAQSSEISSWFNLQITELTVPLTRSHHPFKENSDHTWRYFLVLAIHWIMWNSTNWV